MSGTAAERAPAAPGRRPLLEGALAAAAYAACAHLPLSDGWPVAVGAIAAAFALPRIALPLCVIASMVQDAPGLGPVPALAAVVGCGAAHALRGGWRPIAEAPARLRTCLWACLAAVLVGAAVSLLGSLGIGFEQSDSRPPLAVALGDLAMPVLGAAIGAAAARDAAATGRLAGAAIAGTILIAVRVAAQVLVDPAAGFSEAGSEAIASTLQLSGAAEGGAIRYMGSMLTPNAMSVSFALAALLAWPVIRGCGYLVALLAGGAVVAAAVFAGSKSSLVVAFAVLAAFPASIAPRRTFVLAALAALAFAAWLAFGQGAVEELVARLRMDAIGSATTVRAGAWEACADGLHARDAVLGMGLSHWPVFFERTIGERMADPHTAIFSYPWTYGIAGPVALAAVAWALARVAFRPGAMRAPAIVLLATLLLRDMVAIPLLVGTTVLTLQLWACIALVLARDER